MTLNLTSCRLRLGRASEHLGTLKDEISAWSDTDPYSLVRKRNPDATCYSIFLRVWNEPPLQRWSLITGDCVNNLRAALDHLVYAVAVHETKRDPPPDERRLAFPITDKSNLFVNEARRIKSLSAPVRAEIERLQPYNRLHSDFPPLLSLIRDLNDLDKHRAINVVATLISGGEFDNMRNVTQDNVASIEINTVSLEDGAEIARITLKRPTPDVYYNLGADAHIAVCHRPGPKGVAASAVRHLMTNLRDEVRFVFDQITSLV